MSIKTAVQFLTPIFVGVDVGGTNIKIGIVDDHGQTIADGKFPTHPGKSSRFAFEQAKRELDQLIATTSFTWSDVCAVGLGTPGPMDIRTGKILTPTNLSGWHHSPIRDELAEIVGKPVTLANDAGAAAFGEYWVGSGHHYDSLVLLTLGTGVGGGIIIEGVSIDGFHSHGAEVGHMTIDSCRRARMCGCGQPGHLEAYASATALVDRTREAMSVDTNHDSRSLLNDQISDDSPLSALMIAEAASAGDALAGKMIAETASYLGTGIALLAHIIDPAAFVLGGAMNFGGSSHPLGQKFIADVAAATRKLVFPVLAEKLIVEFAALGGSAGYVGAAGLARQEYRKNN